MEDAAVPVPTTFGLVQPGARGFILGTESLLLEHLCGIVVHEPPADVGDSASSPPKTAPPSGRVSETEIIEVVSRQGPITHSVWFAL